MRAFSVKAPEGTVTGFEVGEGPPLVLLAGLGSTARIWGTLPTSLGRRFRVLALDNRGVGGSRDGGPFSFEGAVSDLEAVLNGRQVPRAALLGASMGGVIALHAALTIPDRVSRLVVASSAAHLSVHGRRVLELIRDLLLYAPPERVGVALMTLAFAPEFHRRYTGFVDQAADLYGLDDPDLPGTLLQVEHLLEGWDLRPRLQAAKTPALVLCGDRDPVVPPEDTEALAGALPHAELVRVAGAAHSVLAEGGETTLDRVLSFLSGDTEPAGPVLV